MPDIHVAALFQKACFRLRERAEALILSQLRRVWWGAQGFRAGPGTILPRLRVIWPHQVILGARCVLEPDIFFKYDGVWSSGPSILIGDDCFIGAGCEFNITSRIEIGPGSAIASGCKFIDHDHGITGQSIDETPGRQCAIVLGKNVWVGVNVVVLRGVTLGDGAVIGAGAVVTKSVPAGEIWAGVPAVKIGERRSANPAR
jgi:acetyltransferase-like isoleucine patch superfamily enzyme